MKDIATLLLLLQNKEKTSVQLTQDALSEVKEREELNAFVEIFEEHAIEQAKKADEMIAAGNTYMLTGIPYAVKDNFSIEGQHVTAASKILEGYVSPYTATAVSRLFDVGAVCIGRTNMDEFAMGSSTEKSCYGPTKNPHDSTRVPGGSSGGSAAVVGAGIVAFALGSDTGGSVRQPASLCGCVGLKPTYGRISRHGLLTLSSSLDVVGIFSSTPVDAKCVFDTIKGRDGYDATLSDTTKKGGASRCIGVPSFAKKAKGRAYEMFEKKLEEVQKKGWKVKEIQMPCAEEALSAYYIIQPAEASGNLARYDGIRFGKQITKPSYVETVKETREALLGVEVKKRIAAGSFVLSAGYRDAYYDRADALRSALKAEFSSHFEEVDILATPTTSDSAFLIGEIQDPLEMYAEDLFTVPVSLAGNPAVSVPIQGEGLPFGIQYIAPPHCDEWLLDIVSEL